MMIYKLNSGKYVRTEDMLRAYEIVFGYPVSETDPRYLRWLWKRLHTSISSCYTDDSVDIRDVAKYNRVLAIFIYRSKTACSLSEAKQFIDDLVDDAVHGG